MTNLLIFLKHFHKLRVTIIKGISAYFRKVLTRGITNILRTLCHLKNALSMYDE